MEKNFENSRNGSQSLLKDSILNKFYTKVSLIYSFTVLILTTHSYLRSMHLMHTHCEIHDRTNRTACISICSGGNQHKDEHILKRNKKRNLKSLLRNEQNYKLSDSKLDRC